MDLDKFNPIVEKRDMTQKSTLKPLFALSFLVLTLLFCCLSSISSGLIGSTYAFQSIEGVSQVNLKVTQTVTQKAVVMKASVSPTLKEKSTNTTIPSATSQPVTQQKPTEKLDNTSIPTNTQTIAPTATNTSTPNPTPTHTETPAPSPTTGVTPTVDTKSLAITQAAKATAETQDMVGVVAKLYTDGIIHSTNGTFHSLPGFEGDWNQTNTYQKTYTGYNLANFVIKADATWEVDGNQGNWSESGCGLDVRETEDGSHYLVYWSLDGRARLMRNIPSGLVMLGRSTIYDVDRNIGQAKVMIVAEDEWIRIFVNGEQKFEKRSDSTPGKLAFTIISGNSKGFGTYCKMSNIGLWEIK